MKEEKHYKRDRRRKKGGIVSTVILVVALAVFCFSGYQLYKIFGGYFKGQKEYDKIREIDVEEKDKNNFRVNFDELLAINPDTVGWLRFYPEPAQINYPLVQTDNNDLYLSKTFSANENTVGAIFLNYINHPDFNDKNTIIYGHRMKDNSMFHELEKYQEKSFWEENQYFYIYTPDGREITYQIYSAGIVKETSDSYITEFSSTEEFDDFLETTRIGSAYETGVQVGSRDLVVTLSTCTKESDDNRMVVRGVKISEKNLD